MSSIVSGQSTTFCTFNIRYDNPGDGYHQWSNRKDQVVDFLKYNDFDFVGIQEALLAQLNFIENGLPTHRRIGVGRDDGKEKGEFSPILYREDRWKLLESGTFWLSETPDQPSKSWDAALPRICTFGIFESFEHGVEVLVMNTHYDHIGVEARRNASKVIMNQVDKLGFSGPVILMGDFNVEIDEEALKPIFSKGFKDSRSLTALTFGPESTFNGFKMDEEPERRIDFLFVNEKVDVLKYMVESKVIQGRYLSDHFPVQISADLN